MRPVLTTQKGQARAQASGTRSWRGLCFPSPVTAPAALNFRHRLGIPGDVGAEFPMLFKELWVPVYSKILWKSCSHRPTKNINQVTISSNVQRQFPRGKTLGYKEEHRQTKGRLGSRKRKWWEERLERTKTGRRGRVQRTISIQAGKDSHCLAVAFCLALILLSLFLFWFVFLSLKINETFLFWGRRNGEVWGKTTSASSVWTVHCQPLLLHWIWHQAREGGREQEWEEGREEGIAKEGKNKVRRPWKEVFAWEKVIKQMKSAEEETCWPGHAAAAPGWLKKCFSYVEQTSSTGRAAAAASWRQLYLGIKNKGRREREGRKQGAASCHLLTSHGCRTSAWEPFEVWFL